jgi:hypothetical protein
MKSRLRFGSALMAVLFLGGLSAGQAQIAASGGKASIKQARERKLRLGIVGYILLPEGYKAYRAKDLRDAWYGYIVSPDNKIRITWSSGMVQNPFQDDEAKFVWVKREIISKDMLKYGLMHTDDGKMIAASVGGIHLYMPIKSEGDMDTFLGIARSYKVEKCDECERPLPEAQPNNGMQRMRN